MSFYLTRFAYTPETWAALIRNPQDREQAVRPTFDAAGCTLHGLWYAFGDHDGFALFEAPDAASAAALAVTIASSGSFRSFETTALMTVKEMVDALGKAADIPFRKHADEPALA